MFTVTDCPEVHSLGYHLKFDARCGPTGYILPHWLSQEEIKPISVRDKKLALEDGEKYVLHIAKNALKTGISNVIP